MLNEEYHINGFNEMKSNVGMIVKQTDLKAAKRQKLMWDSFLELFIMRSFSLHLMPFFEVLVEAFAI